MATPRRGRKILTGLAIGLVVLLVVAGVGFVVMMHSGISSSFGREDSPTHEVIEYTYEDYAADYPRTEVSFASEGTELAGFIYGATTAAPNTPVVVFAHGLGDSHEYYMDELIYLVDAGYLVFAYDATGSGASGGEGTVGLAQSATDLDYALDYAATNPQLSNREILLLGHSWGGFAVTAVLADHPEATAVASLSGYAYPAELLEVVGSESMGMDTSALMPIYQLSSILSHGFSDARRNAVDGINASDTPVLLIHGAADELISLADTSIIAYQEKFTNPQVMVRIWDEPGFDGHVSLLYGGEDPAYTREVYEGYEQVYRDHRGAPSEAEVNAYVAGVDRARAAGVNAALMDEVIAFYRQHTS